MSPAATMPGTEAVLVGRVYDPRTRGPRVVGIHRERAVDLTAQVGTVSQLLEREDAAALVVDAAATSELTLEQLRAGLRGAGPEDAHLLAPIDLQVIKACGVTFAGSLLERLIEEHTRGDADRSEEVRSRLLAAIGTEALTVRPGSPEAARVKATLVEQGLWSQYLEVGIGADPEVFTKAPVLSAVGTGQRIGIPGFSDWSNPEPEVVLVADSRGEVRGAALGNDVNLRDVEGRSALLLGMAKDNNGSTAIGPFIRLFAEGFDIDDLREEVVGLEIRGSDGFSLVDESNTAQISREFEELVRAVHGDHHQYPDGFALFTGTLFAPTADRGQAGRGFTHRIGDEVIISSPSLGMLANVVGRSEEIPRWEFGIRALMEYLRTHS